MRWKIVGEPDDMGDTWCWDLRRHGTIRQVRVSKPSGDQGRQLVASHLDDHNPPDVLGMVPGWDFERDRPAEAEMGFVQVHGMRGRWTDIAQRLNLPHWLQPRP